MAKRDVDATTRTLLRRYAKHLRKQFRHDCWMSAHSDISHSSGYKYHQQERQFHRDRSTHIAGVLKGRGVYLG